VTPTEDSAAPAAGRRLRRSLGAAAGLLAGAVALGAGELVAGLVGPQSSPVVAVGNAAVALTPEWLKEYAIREFGSADKQALIGGVLVVLGLYALVVGLVALRSRALGTAGVAVLGLLGCVAAGTRPAGGLLDGLPSVVGALAGIGALLALVAAVPPAAPPATTAARRPEAVGTDVHEGEENRSADPDPTLVDRLRAALGSGDRTSLGRRRFFLTSGIAVGVAVVAGGGGRLLQRRFDVADERAALTLPRPSSPAPALPAGADLAAGVPGLTPLVTRSRDFYRVDTAIALPQIRPSGYRLQLTGLFGRPRAFSVDDLYRRDDLIERDITLTCVSNPVGGTLAGTARWLGVPLGAFLRENRVRPGSTQLVCRSRDGMTIGAPTGAALGTPDAMLAIGMNGAPLPVAHGFPVRMIIPGLYGYVSACKWLTVIEATTFDAYDAYWVERGYAAQAPIKIESRIDTPASLRSFPAGRRAIAGVAWAQGRGIARVEVEVDDRGWVAAELSPQGTPDIWRQWVLPFDFPPGMHQLTVRATSTDGETQTDRRADGFPDGASGQHSIQVSAV
jgi:DMSO/TMAO reductase YedYZ molybdopterin-dependent catalytic subunit